MEMSEEKSTARKYGKFGLMIAVSMVVMYAVMYLHTFELSHVEWSETRFFMTLLMGASMSAVMLGFMLSMYRNTKLNVAIFVTSAVVFVGATWLVRSQQTVGDTAYMDGMIPHHSIAILTSKRAQLEDVRVQKLARGIAETQIKEIAEMQWLVEDIARNGPATTEAMAESRPVPAFGPDGKRKNNEERDRTQAAIR